MHTFTKIFHPFQLAAAFLYSLYLMMTGIGCYIDGSPAYFLAYSLMGLPLCIFTVIFTRKHFINKTKGLTVILFPIFFVVLFEGLFWSVNEFISITTFL